MTRQDEQLARIDERTDELLRKTDAIFEKLNEQNGRVRQNEIDIASMKTSTKVTAGIISVVIGVAAVALRFLLFWKNR